MNLKRLCICFLLLACVSFLFICCGCESHVPAGQSASPAAPEEPSEQPAAAASVVTPAAPVCDGYYIVRENGRAGVVDGASSLILPFEYSEISIMRDDPAVFFAVRATVRLNGEQQQYDSAFYDAHGACLCEGKYYTAYCMDDGLIQVSAPDGCGVITCEGVEILPCKYESVGMCAGYIVASNHAPGYQKSDVSIFDKSGKLLRNSEVDFEYANENGLLISSDLGNKRGLMDIDFKEILPPVWDDIMPQQDGNIIIGKDAKYGLINSKGEEIAPVTFDNIEPNYNPDYSEVLSYSASSPDGAYIYSPDGGVLFHSDEYTSVRPCNENLIVTDRSGKMHALDVNGNDIMPPADSIYFYADMRLFASNDNSTVTTFYAADGTKLSVPSGSSCISNNRFITFVEKGYYLQGLCDENGVEIVPAEYEYLYPLHYKDDLLIVFCKKDEFGITRAGVMDMDGNVLFSGFTTVTESGYSLFYAKKGDVSGIVDLRGNWVWHTSDYEGLMD